MTSSGTDGPPRDDPRTSPPRVGDERTILEAWLDYHRDTLLWACHGLDDEQLRRRAVPPSSLSLLGLVRHMTEVERSWFRRVLTGEQTAPLHDDDQDPDGEFNRVDSADIAADLASFRAEVDRCRQVGTSHPDLDALAVTHREGAPVSLRWIYVHMIEEYARHNGHADLLRQVIDGRTGD